MGTLLVSLSITAAAGARTLTPAKTKLSRCSIGTWSLPKVEYVEALSVHGVSCDSAKKVMGAYNACRLKHGGVKGKCTARIDGYRTTEKRQTSPDQFIGVVTATNGDREISLTYSVNT